MPTQPKPVSLFDVAKRAVEIADPTDTNADLGDLLIEFEDDDEPVRAVDGIEQRIWEVAGRFDPEIEDPVISMVAAMIIYLSFRRDELHDKPEKIMRLAARAEWKGHPPGIVRDWLEERGVEV